jgi:hypothetical protein
MTGKWQTERGHQLPWKREISVVTGVDYGLDLLGG